MCTYVNEKGKERGSDKKRGGREGAKRKRDRRGNGQKQREMSYILDPSDGVSKVLVVRVVLGGDAKQLQQNVMIFVDPLDLRVGEGEEEREGEREGEGEREREGEGERKGEGGRKRGRGREGEGNKKRRLKIPEFQKNCIGKICTQSFSFLWVLRVTYIESTDTYFYKYTYVTYWKYCNKVYAQLQTYIHTLYIYVHV